MRLLLSRMAYSWRVHSRNLLARLVIALAWAPLGVVAAPVLNEIMYRPGTAYPEITAREFIEIHNPDPAPVDLSGWAITKGADYVFPHGTAIAANGYLVVVANVGAFQTAYPGVANFRGPWAAGATLADKGEKITLSKPGPAAGTWEKVDEVNYADEGDWAVRFRDTLGGWSWFTGANGGGKSLERRNPWLVIDNGQNWGDSIPAGGTPGAVNSLRTTNVAPVITKVQHSPAVPKSSEEVTISCRLTDESPPGALTATLFFRNASGAAPGAFSSAAMIGDGSGRFAVKLPPASDKTIFEFFIAASDATQSRTWPAPNTEGQTTNCQYQVDNEVVAGASPIYRLILTAPENTAYQGIPSSSNRLFNVTLVAMSGDEPAIRYRVSIRNRGSTSRNYTYRPMRVSLPTDDRWDGVTDFALNTKFPWTQFIGMRSLQAAALAGGDAMPVEVRRNGVKYSVAGPTGDFGKWVRLEDIGGDYVDRHWPAAPGGQAYRAESSGATFWSSVGTPPAVPSGSWNGWTKESAHGINDWTDVQGFAVLWQNTAASHFTGAIPGNVQTGTWNSVPFTDEEVNTLSTVADFDHMARWMAVMTIIQDVEPCVSNGGADDYAAAWIKNAAGQRRLQLLPHDLDSVFGKGDELQPYNGTGLYPMTEQGGVFEPLLPLFGNSSFPGNAAFRGKYLQAFRELYGSIFDADTSSNPYPPFHAFIDNHFSGWLPDATRMEIKTFATQRQAHLLGLIGQPKIVPVPTSASTLTSEATGAILINEVLAKNVAAHAHGAAHPAVIELRNRTATPYDVGGMSLSNDPTMPDKFVFPLDTVIPADGILTVYADAEVAEPGWHTGFSLNAAGDSVYLYNPAWAGGALHDTVSFGLQAADLSIARTLADPNTWALTAPTINAPNGDPAMLGNLANLKINEWAGNTKFRLQGDFVELSNPGSLPVALGGVRLTDDHANYPERQTFPALSFLGAKELLLLEGGHLAFKLDANFGYLTLLGANGAWIDQVSIISQRSDRSTGRAQDGAVNTAEFAIPTPGLPNQSAPAAYAALLAGLRITEIMYFPAGGSAYEYIELQNTGGTSLDLSGVRFTNGLDYTFPTGTTLAPSAFIVVCRDRAAFLSRYPAAAGALAPGAFTGALDNSGELIAMTLPAPWTLHILNFRYESTWYPATAGGGRSLVTASQKTSLPKDWEDASTWFPSTAAGGTPGADDVPTMLSATQASGIVGEAFHHQIAATKSPTYQVSNLPPGLTVNATGVISGTPATAGTFSVGIIAANSAGSVETTLTLSISTSGPLHHFTWHYVPPMASAGTAFAVRVTARDSVERVVTSFNGTTNLSAASGLQDSRSPVMISEVADGLEAQFELQNVTNFAADTAGWSVAVGDNQASIGTINPVLHHLPATISAGGVLRISELVGTGRIPFGGAIQWTATASSKGWVALFDQHKIMRDFVVFGWTAADLGMLNSTASNGAVIAPSMTGNWSGNGLTPGTRSTAPNFDSWRRTGAADNQAPADWAWAQGNASLGQVNAGLSLPWFTSTPVGLTPASVNFSAGEFLGYLKFPSAASAVRLTATGPASQLGTSAVITVAEPIPDADGDGLPDNWETANGLSVGVSDAALDADGDGSTNLAEFQAGTDPQVSTSNFIVTATIVNGNQLTVSWNGVAGKVYALQTSNSLPGGWNTRTPCVLATATGVQTAQLDTAGESRFFVRVMMVTE